MIAPEIRAKYKELQAKADAAYVAAQPQRSALEAVEKPWHAICNEIDELLGGPLPDACEGCDEPIFEGDPRAGADDGVLCINCAPTYADILADPGHFRNADDDPMSADEARAVCDQHVAAGGSLEDSLAR